MKQSDSKRKTEKWTRQFKSKDIAVLWRIPFTKENEQTKVERALRERIKELNCLYGVSKLAEKHRDSIEGLLEDLADFIPYSWQYPDKARARITFRGNVFKSEDFKATKWRMSSQIFIYSEPAGELEVVYTEEFPPADEGPFLKEERVLLDALAEQIGNVAARISAEKELQEINRQLTIERKTLQETNAALKTVLARIGDEKKEIYKDINANVEKIIMPILHALSLEATPPQRKFVELLKTSLEDITSPFISRLSISFNSLTPTEINVCNMIRTGMRNKEIAKIRGTSETTINRHRENIRKKLKITNSKINLATFLQTSM